MSINIHFENNSAKINKELKEIGINFLMESILELKSQTQQNCAVDTGRTKASVETYIDEESLIGYVGSDYENFIWEELGTGEFAVNGDGRKTPWKYQDAEGNWHTTKGKRPRNMLSNAFASKQSLIINRAKELFGGLK